MTISRAALACFLLLPVGCSRKAPGPDACHAFARRVYQITDRRALADPRVLGAVNDLTTKCLVTPFDRALLRCVDEGASLDGCLAEFEVRRGRAIEPAR